MPCLSPAAVHYRQLDIALNSDSREGGVSFPNLQITMIKLSRSRGNRQTRAQFPQRHRIETAKTQLQQIACLRRNMTNPRSLLVYKTYFNRQNSIAQYQQLGIELVT